MTLDQDVRTILRARAEGVAAAPVIPHSTLRRARVRKTLMTGGVAVVVAALVFGSFAASRSLMNDAAPLPPADKTEERDTTLVDFPSLTTTFVSPRNGFSVKHPEEVAITPAKQLSGLGMQLDDEFDVVETGLDVIFKGKSADLDAGLPGSIEEQVDEHLEYLASFQDVLPGPCRVPRSQQAEITIDGQPGRISECENRIDAFVFADGRFYLFTLLHDRGDARAVFDTFAATINLTPETAVEFPAMTKTFVSPTYGYSFKYFRLITPATEVWDPVNERFDMSIDFDNRFDANETGYGAYFEGASTPIPDGASIDEWVDEYVSLGSCGVPRSQQAEITIDGRSGRMAQCDHSEATVVAGGRLYLFMGPADDRGWFEAWIETIDLTPETATAP